MAVWHLVRSMPLAFEIIFLANLLDPPQSHSSEDSEASLVKTFVNPNFLASYFLTSNPHPILNYSRDETPHASESQKTGDSDEDEKLLLIS